MVVCGLDMSSKKSGYGLFKDGRLVDYGVWEIPDTKTDWRDKVLWMGDRLKEYISKHKIDKFYVEDVPLILKNPQTLKILSCLQGIILGITSALNAEVIFVPVAKWRTDLGLFDGSRDGMEREKMKQSSVEYANKHFGLDLKWVSKCSKKNQDDTADAINIAYSQIKPKNTFGRKSKVGG